jgi:hypothetical protein
MAFALTGFESTSAPIQGNSQKRGLQIATLYITGLVTDVDLDLGDDSGTFWTDAIANSSTGAMASIVLSLLKQIEARATALLTIDSEQLLDRIQAAAPAGTSYQISIQNKRPNILFAAGNGETVYQIQLTWLLQNFQFPLVTSYGTIS